MIGFLIFVAGFTVGAAAFTLAFGKDVISGRKDTKKPEPEAEPYELDGRYYRMFRVAPEKVEDFLVWVVSNHRRYGRWLDIDREKDSGELIVSCYHNDRALAESYAAAGYPFPQIASYVNTEEENSRVFGIVNTLDDEARSHIELYRVCGRHDFQVAVCIEPGYEDLVDEFGFETDSACERIQDADRPETEKAD